MIYPGIHHAIYDTRGNILSVGIMFQDTQVIETDTLKVFIGEATHEDLIDPSTKTLKKGAKGVAPSMYHRWDMATLAWVCDMIFARLGFKHAVDAERTRRRSQTIAFNGWQLQADDKSYQAVSIKLDALNNRPAGTQPPTTALYWRDSSNTNQSFANVGAFKSFLAGLLSAIDDRNSDIDTWAFDKRDAIDAAADWSALSAIDPAS